MSIKDKPNLVLLSVALFLVATVVGAQSEIYRWVDANGVIHFGGSPPEDSEGIAFEVVSLPDVQTSFSTIPPGDAPVDEASQVENAGFAPARVPASEISPGTATQVCGSSSPSIRRGLDLFDFDAQPALLTRDEIGVFGSVARRMRGRWTGPDTGFACDDGVGGDQSRPLDRTIVAEGDFNPPASFVLESTIRAQGSNFREQLRIDIRDGRLLVNQARATLVYVTDNALSFEYKYRVGGVIRELVWRIELGIARALTVDQLIYSSGALSSHSTWELSMPF